MYVIFPAEQLVECTLSRGIHTNLRQSNLQTTNLIGEQQEQYQHNLLDFESYQQKRLAEEELQALTKSLSKSHKKSASSVRRAATSPPTKMAAGNAASGSGGGDVSLRDLHHPSLNEALKTHNGVTFKLVRTVSDFTQQLSQIYEQHAEELQLLVSNFRKRNSELRKERPNCPSSLFHTWETLLQEVEIDSQAHSDISLILGRQVSRPLLERSFHRKIQSRKVFTHRENFEAMLNKAEDKLGKCRQDYKSAYLSYISSPSSAAMASYLDHHNAYVQQLSLTNAMLEQYHQETLPQLLQELEEIYTDLCSTLSEAVLQGAEIISARAVEQSSRYDSLTSQCKSVASPVDLAHFVRSMTIPHTYPHRPALRHNFVTPQPPTPEVQDGAPLDAQQPPAQRETMNPPPPSLKNEIIIDRLATLPVRSKHEALKKEAQELETQIKQLNDALDTLLRIQQRSLESNLYNKANELQEDISMKRFDVRATQIKLMGANAQKDLFASKVESAADSGRDRKMSSSSTGSMKTKWLKAFKSLKTTSGPSPPSAQPDKKNGGGKGGDANGGLMEAVAHSFQEYTYKKITPCDVCSQVLRGHTRQGMRCRVCKINVHLDCQASATRCQQKSRLLRRQKSTSEIDTRLQEHPSGAEEENVNSSLVAASGSLASDTYRRRRLFAGMKSFSVFASRSRSDSQSRSISLPETPHSPRRQKLNLRMKSLSLDSPESTEHVQRRRHGGGVGGVGAHAEAHSSSSRIQSPSSPVHNRRLLSARNMRMSSVELPDDNEKSLSSASTSPCPSPKPHRLLPTNLYVVLYNFKCRHPDELDLKAGYKVTVIDTSDVDWWKGKCLGRVGYFPSKYVIKLQPGERALQVTHNLQVSDGDNGLMLLRDQIVIQVGEDLDGMVMIRSAEGRQGVCPLKFLQEV